MLEQPKQFEVPKSWTFETPEVVAAFDAHVRSQLPWYDIVSDAAAFLAQEYVPAENGLVYDIGASTGNFYLRLKEAAPGKAFCYNAIEKSEAMRERWMGRPEDFHVANALDVDYLDFDVAILFLTLMFVPPYKRRYLLDALVERRREGGAIIIVDRIIPPASCALILEKLRMRQKLNAGEPASDILAKQLSLVGIQRSVDPALFGPSAYCWFRMGVFAGYLLEG